MSPPPFKAYAKTPVNDLSANESRAAELFGAARKMAAVEMPSVFSPSAKTGLRLSPLRFRTIAVACAVPLIATATVGAVKIWPRFVTEPQAIQRTEIAVPKPLGDVVRQEMPEIEVTRAEKPLPPKKKPIQTPKVIAPVKEETQAETAGKEAPEMKDALAIESEFVQRSIEKLRVESNAKAALEEVTRYETEIGHGALWPEIAWIKYESLKESKNSAAALAWGFSIFEKKLIPQGRLDAFHLVQGELLSEQKQWHSALSEFDAVKSTNSAIEERLLYGRAVALWSLGRVTDAEIAIELYLQRFSNSNRSSQLRALQKN